jgi:hypothetical protein
MAILKRIVFFWVGPDISIPTLLVASIRRHFGELRGCKRILRCL